mmetsp:Transcript_11389/g.20582  ORF Transcript_11389/g.20582 Transcript_11389/m.20582 type:complete len:488 (-) Transcript_11389:219-1682(-)
MNGRVRVKKSSISSSTLTQLSILFSIVTLSIITWDLIRVKFKLDSCSTQLDNYAFHSPELNTIQQHSECTKQDQHFVLLFDLWERLANFRTALQQIMAIGLDSEFKVVEPFVYETKVQYGMHLPYLFRTKNASIQGLSTYFSTETAIENGSLIEYKNWRNSASIHDPSVQSTVGYISALVVFDWKNELPRNSQTADPFWWCDGTHAFSNVIEDGTTSNGLISIGQDVVYERIVCVDGVFVENDKNIGREFFDELFELVKAGTRFRGKCGAITLAFENYRKNGFGKYATHLIKTKYQSQVEMPLSKQYLKLARTVIARKKHELNSNAASIVVHFRMGKTMALLEGQSDSITLSEWANGCLHDLKNRTESIFQTTVKHSSEKPNFFIVSDLFNQGMKGGENPKSIEIRNLIDATKESIFEYFPNATVFNPLEHNLGSDTMGKSALVDLSLAVSADYFVSMRDSFAKLVQYERKLSSKDSDIILCRLNQS